MGNKISVIIPCYNGWKYMDRCLHSLENQTCPPFEIIVVDDCSSDNSYKQLTEYSKTSSLNFVILKNETNVGPGASRGKAINVAKGDYVAFCDGDDWFELNFVEEMTLAIEKESPDVIIFDSYNAYDDRSLRANTLDGIENSKKNILANMRMSLCRLVAKREIVQKVSFPPLYFGEDAAVVPQIIAEANRFTLINKPFYHYYFREGSASQKPSPKACAQLALAFETVKASLSEEHRTECEYIGIKCVCYSAILSGFKSGTPTKQIKEILRTFEEEFPNWTENPYRNNLCKIKNIFLFLISKKWFLPAKVMTYMHGLYVKFRKK